MKLIICLSILCFVGVYNAVANEQSRYKIPEYALTTDSIPITEWLIFGPFKAKTERPLLKNSASHLIQDEAQIGSILNNSASDYANQLLRLKTNRDNPFFEFNRALNLSGADFKEDSTAYVLLNIVSTTDREIQLLLGADDMVRVWLNGAEVFISDDAKHSLVAWDYVIPLKIRTGSNILVCKIHNVDGPWGIVAQLEPGAESAARTLVTKGMHLLEKVLIAPEEPLALTVNGRLLKWIGRGQLCDVVRGGSPQPIHFQNGTEVKNSARKPGLYRLILELSSGVDYKQCVYVGALDNLLAGIERDQLETNYSDQVRIGLGAYIERLRILSRANAENANVNSWDRGVLNSNLQYKAIYAAEHYYSGRERFLSGIDPFRDVTGLSICAFKSQIDDSIQYYRLFVPSCYDRSRSPLPLIIILHPIFSVQRPYIGGVQMANQIEAESWSRVADKLGCGILWVGYRICPYGNPVELTHLDETILSVSRSYAIDYSRLYLYGECSAALGASRAALKNPERYAAIFFLNPVLRRGGNRYKDDGRFLQWPTFRDWLRETDPLIPISKLKIPTVVIHDSMDDAHGPLEHSLAFVEAAKSNGNHVLFERPTSTVGSWFESVVVPKLEWLSAQRKKRGTSFGVTPPKRTGPISEFFTQRFVVVLPTGGSTSESAKNMLLAEGFCGAWKRLNYVDCRTVKDTDLSPDEEIYSNLVLLGSPTSNRVWGRLSPHLPIVLTDEFIRIGTTDIRADSCGVQAWFPHPLIANRKVLLIGSANSQFVEFDTQELEIDGWFDYACYTKDGERGKIIAVGRFR